MTRTRGTDFQVDPHWKFLQDNYGMEVAFQFFGPYRGASIKPHIIDDYTVEVEMPLVADNTNYVGTHFGGSLYSMGDPFFMFILIWNLGSDYIVWDKSAKIDFIKPGTGTVKARFHIPESELQDIRQELKTKKKTIRWYTAEVCNPDGKVAARLDKELYIRRKSGVNT